MAKPNSLTKYVLKKYDDQNAGTIGIVDAAEKARFIGEELDLRGTYTKSDLEAAFAKWKPAAVVKAPYLSDLIFQEFRDALLNHQRIHIGDTNASQSWNSPETVRNVKYAQQKAVAFSLADSSSPVTFNVEMESVNAYVGAQSKKMLSFTRLYIVPDGYRGNFPPSAEEKGEWCKGRLQNCENPSEIDKYFAEIAPGKTNADNAHYEHKKGYANFRFTLNMPPSNYELHAIAGRYADDNDPLDNFDVDVVSQNAKIDAEKTVAIESRPPEDGTNRSSEKSADFVSSIVEPVKEGSNYKKIELVFAIDHSGSMQSAVELVKNNVENIILEFIKRGVEEIRIGVVIFSDTSKINILSPLTMIHSDNSVDEIRKKLETLSFEGGLEPVGEAVEMAVSLFSNDKNVLHEVVTITDTDGLADDRSIKPYYSEVASRFAKSGIVFNLQLMDEVFKKGSLISILQSDVTFNQEAAEQLLSIDRGALFNTLNNMFNPERPGIPGQKCWEAAKILIKLGEKKAVEFFFNDAMVELNSTASVDIITSLGEHGKSYYTRLSTEAMSNDVRFKAACALMPFDKDKARDALKKLLDEDISDGLRLDIAKNLIPLDMDIAKSVLEKLTLSASEPIYRKEASKLLKSLSRRSRGKH